MATRGATQVTAGVIGLPDPIGGLKLEVWRVQGGTVGDTIAVTPARGRFVVAAGGAPASTTISTLGTATSVTFTLIASSATDVTYDTWLYVQD